MFRKNDQIFLIYVENKKSLAQITFHFGLKIDVNNQLLPMFGFWFVNCTENPAKISCQPARKYLGDNHVDNVHLFMKMLFMPSLVESISRM